MPRGIGTGGGAGIGGVAGGAAGSDDGAGCGGARDAAPGGRAVAAVGAAVLAVAGCAAAASGVDPVSPMAASLAPVGQHPHLLRLSIGWVRWGATWLCWYRRRIQLSVVGRTAPALLVVTLHLHPCHRNAHSGTRPRQISAPLPVTNCRSCYQHRLSARIPRNPIGSRTWTCVCSNSAFSPTPSLLLPGTARLVVPPVIPHTQHRARQTTRKTQGSRGGRDSATQHIVSTARCGAAVARIRGYPVVSFVPPSVGVGRVGRG